eukprot:jgi/Ulvmu1/3694/UM017_0111.1
MMKICSPWRRSFSAAVQWTVLVLALVVFTQSSAQSALSSRTAGSKPTSSRDRFHAFRDGPEARHSRGLLQTNVVAASPDADADITVVSTATQFQAAMMSGAQDIELREHLDLSGLALAFTSNVSLPPTALGEVKATTRSIRGNCTIAPPSAAAFGLFGPDFLWTAPQCVIVSDHDIIWAHRPLWIDALHLRHRPGSWFRANLVKGEHKAEIYGTRLTFQGSGAYNTTAAAVSLGARALFDGCKFDHTGGQHETLHVYDASMVLADAIVSNVFQRNSWSEYSASNAAFKYAAVITAASVSGSTTVAVINTTFQSIDAVDLFWVADALLAVDGLTYSNVTTERNQWNAAGALVGSADGGGVAQEYRSGPMEPAPLSALKSLTATGLTPLSLDDAWIVGVQQSIAAASPAQIQTAPDPPPNPPAPPALGVAGDAPPSVAAVYTAFEFQDAFHEGVRDIEIRNHLDLRLLPTPRDPIIKLGRSTFQIGVVGTPTRSIRGRCTKPPAGSLASAALALDIANEEPWASPRCVIITEEDLFLIDRSRLWLDSLHIQFIDGENSPVAIWSQSWGHAYVTNTVVQGDRASQGGAVQAYRNGGGVYAEGCVFNALEGDSKLERAMIIVNSNAWFKSCVFRGLSQAQELDVPGQWNPAYGALTANGLNTTVVLENCTIGRNYNEWLFVVSQGATLYSDNPQQTSFGSGTWRTYQPQPLAGLANRTARTPPPLQGSDPWFVAAKQALASPPASAYLSAYPVNDTRAIAPPATPTQAPTPSPAPPASPAPAPVPTGGNNRTLPVPVNPDDSELDPADQDTIPGEDEATAAPGESGPSPGLVVGIAIACVLLLCLCALVTFCVLARRRRQRKARMSGAIPDQAPDDGLAPDDLGKQKPPGAMPGPGGPVGAQHFDQGGFLGGMPPMAMYQYPPGHPYGYHRAGHPHGYHPAPPHGRQMYGGPGMHMGQHLGATPGMGYPSGHAEADARNMGMHNMQPQGGGPSFYCSSSHGSAAAERRASLNASSATITNITKATWTDFQKAGGEAGSPVEELQVALDAMSSMQAPFYNRYRLSSAVDRRVGGQGVVQFAGIASTLDRAAVKFYIDRSAFDRERELYTESQLKAMMPATLAIEDNASGKVCTPYGYVFPPFVIIECGQSLDEWARDTANKDFITIFQALSHAVRALRRLHEFGYAHRDIKPGNILRRPKQHDWTLIDFGCTAQIGSTAGLSFSLKYAAPEVVHALEVGSRSIHVDAAVDIWAIGVIAFELLTGDHAFPTHNMSAAEAEHAAREAIAGRAALPWEGDSQETRERLDALRGMRRTVLRCLERDPAKRPSAAALVSSWDHTFDNMHTRGTDWSAGS